MATTPTPTTAFGLKDSGTRMQFATGSQRDRSDGKGRPDLFAWLAWFRVCGVFERGGVKYDENNWRKGQPFSRMFASGVRHAVMWFIGFRDEDHLAMAVWNFLCILEFEELGRTDLDDRIIHPDDARDRLLATFAEQREIVGAMRDAKAAHDAVPSRAAA